MKIINLILILISTIIYAQKDSSKLANIDAPYYNINETGLALNGFDPTEYFINNRATQGSEKHQYQHQGVIYYFVNEKNKSLFIESPEKYMPEFGGYCAYGLGMEFGHGLNENPPGKYPVNPETFKIINDKLYLFYNNRGYNFLEVWKPNEIDNLKRANERWEVINEKN
ncbi:YHS domain-containing (seleno)protein [uncultured Algibacter sp.]|uniref:YHS domain-containing (seleno)protein n=1 Tax=uncultured Algibacter sp. TaxID=298659 RepID=UPI0026348859|nr:YHS domain-containing (seleno)protein [uncultured Algibacter sp.]